MKKPTRFTEFISVTLARLMMLTVICGPVMPLAFLGARLGAGYLVITWQQVC